MLNLRALVIGGGIGGLAAAIALQRTGAEVEVFERAAELREVGAGLSLWANAVKALHRLGLDREVSTLATEDVDGSLRSWRGALLLRMPAAEMRRRLSAPSLMVPRADLLSILVKALGSERVHLGSRCTGFHQEGEGVTAQFAEGRTAQGDLLVGADGLHSQVRAQLHGPQKPTYAGYTAWRGVVSFDHHRLLPGESWGRGARFGHAPMRQGRVYWYATRNAPEAQHSPDGEKAELLRNFRGWHDPVEALIEATDASAILRNDIYDRPPLQAWGEGRVTLLGDAAHPMTPNLGQGACQALEDAVVLADCLLDNSDVATVVRSYEARRIPRTSFVVRQSRQLGWMGQWESPLAVWVRGFLVSQVIARLQGASSNRILGYEV